MNCTGIVGQQSDGTNRGQSWHVMDSRDFNATGSSTLPWQGDNGQPAVWLMDDAIQVGRQRRHRGHPGLAHHCLVLEGPRPSASLERRAHFTGFSA